MDTWWWILIGADALLCAAVAILFWKQKAPGHAPGQVADPSAFVAEAGRLAAEFDRLLADKRELIRTTLDSLDRRILELQRLAAELAPAPTSPRRAAAALSAEEAPPAPGSEGGEGMEAFRRQVLALARQGKKAAQIAEATGHPRGEVELVLGLLGQAR